MTGSLDGVVNARSSIHSRTPGAAAPDLIIFLQFPPQSGKQRRLRLFFLLNFDQATREVHLA